MTFFHFGSNHQKWEPNHSAEYFLFIWKQSAQGIDLAPIFGELIWYKQPLILRETYIWLVIDYLGMKIFCPLKGTMEYTLPAPLTMPVINSFKFIFQAKIGVEAVALPRILSHPQPEQLRPSAKLSPNSTVNLLVSIWILINTEKDSKLTTGGHGFCAPREPY